MNFDHLYAKAWNPANFKPCCDDGEHKHEEEKKEEE